MEALSVIIISYNEEKSIGRCIESIQSVADEIIVLDSYSEDATVSIAQNKGAQVFQRKFTGYIEQKNHALSLAGYNLVFCLDADEVADEELIRSVQLIKQFSVGGAFSMKRLNIYCGKPIKSGLWYPDRKVRIFYRDAARWGGLNPHDRVVFAQPATIHHLPGHLLHYSFDTKTDHLRRNEELSSIAAQSYYEAGIPFRWYRWLFSPAWTFINGYLLRGGLRAGRAGFAIACRTAHYAFQKHDRLRRLYRDQDRATNTKNRSVQLAK